MQHTPVELLSSASSSAPSQPPAHAATVAAPRETARFASATRRSVPLEPGVVIDDRYELIRLLGTGATGVVWEAAHRVLTKRVAIKFLDVAPADSSKQRVLLERFRYEAQVSARLAESTQHIVAVHDTAIFGSRHYIVMDLASGRSVESVVESERMPLTSARTMLRQVGDALRVAHQAGIVHRDVKPANILVADDPTTGEPVFKLADFGVAKSFGSPFDGALLPTRTSSGLSVGSPAYMSPEQVQGMRTVDASPDIWALAVVLYEALTQVMPFDGNSFADLACNIVKSSYPAITSLAPSLPSELDAFFARAFAASKTDRFQTVEALLDAFDVAIGVDQPFELVSVRAQSAVDPSERAVSSRPPASRTSEPEVRVASRPRQDDVTTGSVGPATTSLRRAPPPREQRVWGGALVLGVLLVLATVMTTLVFTRAEESVADPNVSASRSRDVDERTQLELTRNPTAPTPQQEDTLVTPVPRSAQAAPTVEATASEGAAPKAAAPPSASAAPRPSRPVNPSEVY